MSIKAGDLVMVVRPSTCCGDSSGMGEIFQARAAEIRARGKCMVCQSVITDYFGVQKEGRRWFQAGRLKKIDPPADGDSLPTRKDLEVPA